MATLKFFPIISNSPGNAITLTTGQQQIVTTGQRVLIRVVATQGVNIRFGKSLTGTPATASDMYLPANTVEIYDMGDMNDSLAVYNSTTSSATVWINAVSKA